MVQDGREATPLTASVIQSAPVAVRMCALWSALPEMYVVRAACVCTACAVPTTILQLGRAVAGSCMALHNAQRAASEWGTLSFRSVAVSKTANKPSRCIAIIADPSGVHCADTNAHRSASSWATRHGSSKDDEVVVPVRHGEATAMQCGATPSPPSSPHVPVQHEMVSSL